jgi:hypothetical protein
MPRRNSVWIAAIAAIAALVGLTACASVMAKPPELLSGSEAEVVIVADLHSSPRPLAKSHCAQYGKRPTPRDTAPAVGNLLRGWAIGTKVFIYTFDCR